ncbi:MAG TPA: UDP-N-acetylglucosamine diphosphorylase/glucosamine-1-phosphate N-acetyltransferase [Anaerolineae bacterium]|nr:UDP-N-acetylglucosamine diphosphorylase/glucosamine-1-phosphate N-acetyltransferase [Anaerolineae bacterium]HIQ09102.1 UDP-N-acetylglucosamine diphosphorylase/glucosamine-1-phosphate N-acetyltransferase [Anaerolineaceae bacterium]
MSDAVMAVVLAAGKGTRMKSNLPKVLHPLLGKPMLVYAVAAAQEATGVPPVVVVGHQAGRVQQTFAETGVRFVVQDPPLGTGHAVQQAQQAAQDARWVLVTNGDMPLIRGETLRRLVEAQRAHPGPITLLTVIAEDPRGFGRVVRDEQGFVRAIVEEADATPEQKAIRELNVGAYCFDAAWLWEHLPRLPLSPKGEYYLTDLIGLAVAEGQSVQALTLEDPTEAIGVNTRVHLAEAMRVLQRRIHEHWMLAGVTLVDPERTYIESTVTLGQDTVVWPDTYLLGDTHIGEGCEIGPNTYIRDTRVGHRCKIFASVLKQAVVEDEVDIGPYGHLRKGAHLARGVHMGNFGEVKNAYLGPGTKMGHFSYIGDATIGAEVNIGAGTITCNYDGVRKHHTTIEDGVFIGSDTMLVAPVHLGKGARTGAGAVVTKDLPPFTLAVGMPARVIRRLQPPEEAADEAG